jgi:malonyl-ACP O-methyltransferase BioC
VKGYEPRQDSLTHSPTHPRTLSPSFLPPKYRYPMIWHHNKAATDLPVIFLPGWGFSGRIIELVRPSLPWIYPEGPIDPDSFREDLLALLEWLGLGRVRLVGWSMGAHLALDFAREHPGQVEELYLLAMRHERLAAEIEAIRRELTQDPQGFLATFYRKCFLGERRHYQYFQAELEEEWLREPPLAILHRGLDYLARVRTLPAPVKTRLVHGRRDVIVRLAEQAVLPAAASEVLDHAGHLVFLSPEFSLVGRERKEMIRRRFSQAAATYDLHAGVQKEVARLLAARLPREEIGSILELGCGTGSYSLLLADRYPAAAMRVLDFSGTMIETAKMKLGVRPQVGFQCEDAEDFLERTEDCFDLITANATMQWFVDLEAALVHISRILNPAGLFLASIFGPATLDELRQGLSILLGREIELPSGRFPDAEILRQSLSRHFTGAGLEEIRIIRQYGSLPELLHHIRNTGTAGWHQQPPPVFTRQRLRKLDEWFADRYGGYRLTYQVFLVQGQGKAETCP